MDQQQPTRNLNKNSTKIALQAAWIPTWIFPPTHLDFCPLRGPLSKIQNVSRKKLCYTSGEGLGIKNHVVILVAVVAVAVVVTVVVMVITVVVIVIVI